MIKVNLSPQLQEVPLNSTYLTCLLISAAAFSDGKYDPNVLHEASTITLTKKII